MAKKKKTKEKLTPAQEKMIALKKALNKDVGNVVYEDHEGEYGRVELGAIKIDYAFGGGLPKGRITELYGWESTSKSSISLMYLKKFLDESETNIAMYVDAEFAHDKKYMKDLGIDLDRVIIATPSTTEDTFKAILSASDLGVGFMIVDSVSAMMSVQEYEKGMDGQTIGSGARVMSTGLKQVVGNIRKNNICCIFINQFRNTIGGYGDNRTTSGGNALKFYASIRAEMKAKKTKAAISLNEEGEAVSNPGGIYVTKNKTAPPFREASFTSEFGKGINIKEHNVMTAIEEGIIERGGAWYSIPLKNGEIERVQGSDKVWGFYLNNEEEYQYLYEITKQNFY